MLHVNALFNKVPRGIRNFNIFLLFTSRYLKMSLMIFLNLYIFTFFLLIYVQLCTKFMISFTVPLSLFITIAMIQNKFRKQLNVYIDAISLHNQSLSSK